MSHALVRRRLMDASRTRAAEATAAHSRARGAETDSRPRGVDWHLFVLRSGIPWKMFPTEIGCSGSTCCRWLVQWQRAGVWKRLRCVLLTELRLSFAKMPSARR